MANYEITIVFKTEVRNRRTELEARIRALRELEAILDEYDRDPEIIAHGAASSMTVKAKEVE